jgi:hypothetical protein
MVAEAAALEEARLASQLGRIMSMDGRAARAVPFPLPPARYEPSHISEQWVCSWNCLRVSHSCGRYGFVHEITQGSDAASPFSPS